MPVQIVMDATGDTRHEFDKTDVEAVKAAEKRFKELTGAGFTPAERTGPGTADIVRRFNPNAEETVFIPRLKGG